MRYEVIGLEGLPEIRAGQDVAPMIVEAARRQGTPIQGGDLLVVSQKIISKAEGRIVRLSAVTVSASARSVAEEIGRDPRLVEVILSESRRIVRKAKDVLIGGRSEDDSQSFMRARVVGQFALICVIMAIWSISQH